MKTDRMKSQDASFHQTPCRPKASPPAGGERSGTCWTFSFSKPSWKTAQEGKESRQSCCPFRKTKVGPLSEYFYPPFNYIYSKNLQKQWVLNIFSKPSQNYLTK
ncbi:hypothetical protein FQA47_023571 [Oryzias melastigma]|uniref:Uncharacterized protein n=1 Tax=Oryzias melastigma TaxID=30732 RepID=A0A834FP77_ORYME|nr:hypothetical protein FQA47_023571 [Oryzias melastigma]